MRRPLLNGRGVKHVVNVHALTLVWQSLMPNSTECFQKPKEDACNTLLMVCHECCHSFAKNGAKLHRARKPQEVDQEVVYTIKNTTGKSP